MPTHPASLRKLAVWAVLSLGSPLVLAAEGHAASTDWHGWRGPNGDGHSPLKGIRKDWTGGLKKVWEVKGLSPDTCCWSSPSVQGERLVVTGQRADPANPKVNIDKVCCYDADKGGEPLWMTEFPDAYSDYGWSTGPTSAPRMDGERVYVASREGTVYCLSMADGKKIWNKPAMAACHGYGASFLVWDDLLILPGIGNALLGAVDKMTGKEVWRYKQAKPGDSPEYGHVTPRRLTLNGTEQVLYSTGALVCGMEPKTGKPLWEYELPKGFGGNYTPCGPVNDGALLYVTTSDAKPPCGLQLEGNAAKELWKGYTGHKAKYGPSLGSGVMVDGFAYTFVTAKGGANDWFFGAGPEGYLICVDPKTGQVKWEQKTGNGFILAVDGCLLGLTHKGDLLLVAPMPEGFRKITEWPKAIVTKTWMFQGKEHRKEPAPCWSVPIIARGKLYLRYDDTLTCYDLCHGP